MDQLCDWNTNLTNHFIYESIEAKYVTVLTVISCENYGY
jgi:hypothetical protein